MARNQYNERLTTLRTDIILLAETIIERYEDAVDALVAGNTRRADQIVRQDDEINSRYLELEQECTTLIARRQPVASELRLVTASFKILTYLERIGDLAVNLAGRTEYGTAEIHEAINVRALGMEAGKMVVAAVDAYETETSNACRAVAATDTKLDADCEAANRQLIRELIDERSASGQDEREPAATVDRTTRALLTIRDIERVGDHAVNIAARTLYMLDGDNDLLY
jgi:phosphate transport system regulatory protein PhoU